MTTDTDDERADGRVVPQNTFVAEDGTADFQSLLRSSLEDMQVARTGTGEPILVSPRKSARQRFQESHHAVYHDDEGQESLSDAV